MEKNYKELSDEQLAGLSAKGDAAAAEFLMNKYKPLVRKLARVFFLEGGDEEDLLLEGMWGLFSAVKGFLPEKGASFYTFARLCVSRRLISVVDAAGRKSMDPLNHSVFFSELEDMEMPTLADSSLNPEKQLLEAEAEEELMGKIKKALSRKEYAVFEYYVSGMDYLSIAEKMNCSKKSIDNTLQRIKRKITEMKNSST